MEEWLDYGRVTDIRSGEVPFVQKYNAKFVCINTGHECVVLACLPCNGGFGLVVFLKWQKFGYTIRMKYFSLFLRFDTVRKNTNHN